jgi:Secretion system C-terminal sorting domain
LQWGTVYGGSADEWLSMSLATAPDGDLAVMTLTSSTNFPFTTPGGPAFYDNTFNGTYDMFITRFQSNMSLYWNTYYGSSNNDHCQHNLTMDALGRIIIVGVSDGLVAPPTFNPGSGHYYNGIKDAEGTYCIAQFDTTCAMLWGTFYGGSGHDHLFGTVGGCIGVSEHSDIFISAETNSTNLTMVNPGGGAYFQNINAGGGKEGFVLKFNNDINTVILDINLLQLTGERQGQENLLRWEVGAASTADRFLIEHEQDGDFKFIGGVTATGATQYSFSDAQAPTGSNRYRLKIYDKNGFFQYSNIVEIRTAGAGVEVNVWPNPATNRVSLQLITDGKRSLNVQVTDLTGRILLQQQHSQSGSWENDFSTWARGSYIVTVMDAQTGEKVYSKPLVLR